VTVEAAAGERATIHRALAWALVAALSVAALVAIGAILTGGFDETDGRVIATSLGFAVCSATAASGATLRFRASAALRTLGAATGALSAAAFVFLVVALWSGEDDTWRWFGCVALAALACSHASLVAGALRASDTPSVRALAKASIALGVVDASCGILAVAGTLDDVDESLGKLVAVLVVLLLLTTALPPILRRVQRAAASPGDAAARVDLAAEVLAAAERIDALNADPGNRAAEIRRECDRLRELARAHAR
jgi:hypothetical protein